MTTQHVNSITQWCTLREVGESEEESEERESLDKHLASGKLRPGNDKYGRYSPTSICEPRHQTCIRAHIHGNEYLYLWIQIPDGMPYEYPLQVLTGPGTHGMPWSKQDMNGRQEYESISSFSSAVNFPVSSSSLAVKYSHSDGSGEESLTDSSSGIML